MTTTVIISTTLYSTLPCDHAYGDAWLVTGPGLDLLVCGTQLPKYLAKRLDTAVDTGGVRYTSSDEQGDALYAGAEFTAADIELLRTAAEVSETRRARIEWDLRRAARVSM